MASLLTIGEADGQDDMLLAGSELVIGPEGSDKEEYVKVEGVVDTGAEDHALEEGIMEWIPIEPSALSKAGRAFRGPNHSRIPAKGRRRFQAVLSNGLKAHLSGEVCPVKRTLLNGQSWRRQETGWSVRTARLISRT